MRCFWLLVVGLAVTTLGCREAIVNVTAWAIALPLEEAGVLKPAPGNRPARDYFLGYRVEMVEYTDENGDQATRELYTRKDRKLYGTPDRDGGVSRMIVPTGSGKKPSYESFSPSGDRRPIPSDSLFFLNRYAY